MSTSQLRHGLGRPLRALSEVHKEQVRAWELFFRIRTPQASAPADSRPPGGSNVSGAAGPDMRTRAA
jgi:hypothetical protein